MSYIISANIGLEICKALKIDTELVSSVTIKIEPDDIVRVEVVQYVPDDELQGLKEVLRKYHWEEDFENEKD